MITDAMDLQEFREVTAAIGQTVSDDAHRARLTGLEFEVDGMPMRLVCDADGGVVLCLGDARVPLSRKQLTVLKDLIEILMVSLEMT